MNFKKLGSVLSKRKMLYLCTAEDGVQWAGDNMSLYELSGMPKFTIDSLLFVFGVNMEKKEAWITTETFFPESYDTALEIQDDLPISIDENSICWHGTQYSILHAMDRCFVIPERYLTPIWSDQMHLFMRIMPKTGEMKIIAKEGLFISAIFEPVKAEQELREWLIKTNNAIW